MPTVNVNGINLYYEDTGSGNPMIFVPGLGGTTELWAYQTRYFQQFYRCIALDNRGAGRSDKPLTGYTMETFASDLNGLLDALGIDEPTTLVGASMGGIISQAFIHDYPQRVKRLILACSGVSGGDPHITMCSPEVMGKLANPGNTAEEKVNTLLEIFYHPEFVRQNPGVRDAYLQRKTDPQPPHAYMGQLAACSDRRPYYQWLAEIRVPTLILHGTDDIVWPLQNARTLAEGIGANARLHIIPESAHIFMHEKPEEFNRAIEEFLRETD